MGYYLKKFCSGIIHRSSLTSSDLVSCFDQITHRKRAHNLSGESYAGTLGKDWNSWFGLTLGRTRLSNVEIASNLDITEGRVHDCVPLMQRFLHCEDRNELMRDALHSRVM